MTFENFNCIKIRLRGDGRKYWLEMSTSVIDNIRHVYRYPIHTRGGPLWEEFEVCIVCYSILDHGRFFAPPKIYLYIFKLISRTVLSESFF